MAKDKSSFTAYCDWIHSVEDLTDEEAGKLFKHILRYVNDQDPQIDDRIVQIAFNPIKTTLKRDLKKWEAKCEKNRENIRKRWKEKNTTVYDRIPKHTKRTDRDRDRDSDTDRDIKKREANFKNEILPFIEKGVIKGDDARDFISYWTEHGSRDKKMRFEKEKSFSIERRISTWLRNKAKFEKEKSSAKKEKGHLTLEDLQNLAQ